MQCMYTIVHLYFYLYDYVKVYHDYNSILDAMKQAHQDKKLKVGCLDFSLLWMLTAAYYSRPEMRGEMSLILTPPPSSSFHKHRYSSVEQAECLKLTYSSYAA